MSSPMQSIDPAAIAAASQPMVHVFTDDQFKQLLATVTPGPDFVAKAETAVKTGAEETVANFKALVTDVQNTLGHVHGAAKQLQLDVQSNWVMLAIGGVTLMNTALLLKPLLHL